MKKKYIIFCYNITGMGGGQQYVYTKARFLEIQGYDVSVFSAIEGDIVIKWLEKYSSLIRRELKYPPSSFRYCYIQKVLNSIVDTFCGQYEDILVESNGGYETQWAEMVAQRLGAQHIVFNVAEQQNKTYSKDFLDYFYFKYQRQELYGITGDSLKIMFRNYKEIEDSAEYAFSAPCNNVVDEYDTTTKADLPEADYNIGGIWRTNKEGFVEAMLSIVPFVKKHADMKFNLVIIGAGSQVNENRVKEEFAQHPNVNVVFLGFMYPIPMALLLDIDVFISTAGSSRVPMKYGIPSITVTSADMPDGSVKLYTLGILNYTTRNTVVPEDSGYSTDKLLEMIIFDKFCEHNQTLGMESERFVEEDELRKELSKYGQVGPDYYDINTIRPSLRMEKAYSLIGRSVGAKALFALDKLGHNLKNRK